MPGDGDERDLVAARLAEHAQDQSQHHAGILRNRHAVRTGDGHHVGAIQVMDRGTSMPMTAAGTMPKSESAE